MAQLSADHVIYMCVFVLLSFHAVKMSHLSSAYCQDGAVLEDYVITCVYFYFCHFMMSRCHIFLRPILSRWRIFQQIMFFTCVCICFLFFMLSRCCTFLQHTAKIVAHLSADHVIYMCVYWFLSHFMLSRCHIFQHTAKISHLSSGPTIYMRVPVFLSLLSLTCHTVCYYCAEFER